MPLAAAHVGQSSPPSETKNSGALYMIMMALMMGVGIPILCRDSWSAACSTLSMACFQSIKNKCRGEAFCLNKS